MVSIISQKYTLKFIFRIHIKEYIAVNMHNILVNKKINIVQVWNIPIIIRDIKCISDRRYRLFLGLSICFYKFKEYYCLNIFVNFWNTKQVLTEKIC